MATGPNVASSWRRKWGKRRIRVALSYSPPVFLRHFRLLCAKAGIFRMWTITFSMSTRLDGPSVACTDILGQFVCHMEPQQFEILHKPYNTLLKKKRFQKSTLCSEEKRPHVLAPPSVYLCPVPCALLCTQLSFCHLWVQVAPCRCGHQPWRTRKPAETTLQTRSWSA